MNKEEDGSIDIIDSYMGKIERKGFSSTKLLKLLSSSDPNTIKTCIKIMESVIEHKFLSIWKDNSFVQFRITDKEYINNEIK